MGAAAGAQTPRVPPGVFQHDEVFHEDAEVLDDPVKGDRVDQLTAEEVVTVDRSVLEADEGDFADRGHRVGVGGLANAPDLGGAFGAGQVEHGEPGLGVGDDQVVVREDRFADRTGGVEGGEFDRAHARSDVEDIHSVRAVAEDGEVVSGGHEVREGSAARGDGGQNAGEDRVSTRRVAPHQNFEPVRHGVPVGVRLIDPGAYDPFRAVAQVIGVRIRFVVVTKGDRRDLGVPSVARGYEGGRADHQGGRFEHPDFVVTVGADDDPVGTALSDFHPLGENGGRAVLFGFRADPFDENEGFSFVRVEVAAHRLEEKFFPLPGEVHQLTVQAGTGTSARQRPVGLGGGLQFGQQFRTVALQGRLPGDSLGLAKQAVQSERVVFPFFKLGFDAATGAFEGLGEVRVGGGNPRLGLAVHGRHDRFVPDGQGGRGETVPKIVPSQESSRLLRELGVQKSVFFGVLAENFPILPAGVSPGGESDPRRKNVSGETQVALVGSEHRFLDPFGELAQADEFVFRNTHRGMAHRAGLLHGVLEGRTRQDRFAEDFGSGARSVPTGLSDADSRIGLQVKPVRADRHGAGDFPNPGVVVEAPKSRFGSGRQVVRIGKTGRDGDVEIARAVGLHRDDQGHGEGFGQGFGQTVGGHRGDPHASAGRSVVGLEGSGRDGDGGGFEHRLLFGVQTVHVARGEGNLRLLGGAHRLEGSFLDQGQKDFSVFGAWLVSSVLGVGSVTGRLHGFSRHRFPGFAHEGVIVTVAPGSVGQSFSRRRSHHPAVDHHEEFADRCLGQTEGSVRVGRHAQFLFVAHDRDEHARQGLFTVRIVRVEHLSRDHRAVVAGLHRKGRERPGFLASRYAVPVQVDPAVEEIRKVRSVQGDRDPTVRGPTVSVQKEARFHPVAREAGRGDLQFVPRVGVEGFVGQHRPFGQRHVETHHEFARQGDVSFPVVR